MNLIPFAFLFFIFYFLFLFFVELCLYLAAEKAAERKRK